MIRIWYIELKFLINQMNKHKNQKYTPKLLEAAKEWIMINGLMLFGGAPLGEYCKAMGIHTKSHYNWLKQFSEYRQLIDECTEYYRQNNTKKLYNALLESALGGYRENTVEDVEYKPNPANPEKPMIAKKKTHKEKRYYKSDTGAAIFLISNLCPENFINRQRSDVNIKETQVRQLSIDEARQLIQSLEENY